MLKLSNEMYDMQKYFFVGAQYNWNFMGGKFQTPDWLDVSSRKLKKGEFVFGTMIKEIWMVVIQCCHKFKV